VKLLGYAPENRPSNRKMAIEKLEVNYKTHSKTKINLQIKAIKRAMNSSDLNTDTTQKSRICVFRILNIANTVYGEYC